MRFWVIAIYRLSLVVGWISLLYLLFVYGHTDLTPTRNLWIAATIASICALTAGILRWAGLPADPAGKKKKQGKLRH